MRKVALIGFILFLLVGSGWIGYAAYLKVTAEEEAPAPRGRPTVAVEVEEVKRGTIREIRSLTGTLMAAHRVNVASKISGQIEELMVNLGDRVERDAVIARLDSEELEQALVQARAEHQRVLGNLEKARAEAEQAERELERIRRLRERQVASESDLDNAELALSIRRADVRIMEAEAAQREAAVRGAEIRLEQSVIRTNWNEGGPYRTVASRHIDPGEVVSANQTLLTLVDLGTMIAVLYVTERDYPRLRAGQEVTIRADSLPGREFTGTITRLAPRFDEGSRQARIEVEVENEGEALRPGMFVRADVLLRESEDTIIIPSRAVVSRRGTNGIFLADRENGRASFVEVELGIMEGDLVEVLRPELEGEVVTLGQNLIEEDTPLTFATRRGQEPPPEETPLETPGALTDSALGGAG